MTEADEEQQTVFDECLRVLVNTPPRPRKTTEETELKDGQDQETMDNTEENQ